MISFKATPNEHILVIKIVNRAFELMKDLNLHSNKLDLQMDIFATHANGCPLDLQKFLDADNFNFAHDICGIFNCLDRKTGKLKNCFLPRCSMLERKECTT